MTREDEVTEDNFFNRFAKEFESRRKKLIKVLSIFARGAEVKISILELLLKYGCLHLSALRRYLAEEKNIKVSISTLHKYINEMENIGILMCEKGKKFNMLFISISDTAPIGWLLAEIPCVLPDAKCVENIAYYIRIAKPNWDNVIIRSWSNKRMTLGEYAPLLVFMLTASRVDPYKQIVVLNNIAKRIGVGTSNSIEISIGELKKFIKDEIRRISPLCLTFFEELQKKGVNMDEFKAFIEKRLPTSLIKFVTVTGGEPSPRVLQQIREDEERRLKAWRRMWELYVLPNF